MSSVQKIKETISRIMDDVPSIEGIIVSKVNGTIVASQTIVSYDESTLQSFVGAVLDAAKLLAKASNNVKKGVLRDILVNGGKGSFLMVGASDIVVISLVGLDGRPHIALIRKKLEALLKQLT